jgi:hypothetical protein
MQSKHWTRLELLSATDAIWGRYLKILAALPPAQQTAYARRNGYAEPKELIAHVTAWLAETRRVIPYLLRDQSPPRDYANDAEFNARAIDRCQTQSRAQVEAEFKQQRRALKKVLTFLPDEALEISRVYRWLSATIIDHYIEHELPDWPVTKLFDKGAA